MAGQSRAKAGFTSHFQELNTTSSPTMPTSTLRLLTLTTRTRLALLTLASISGLIIMAVTAETLSAYNSTNLGQEYHLPIWPASFDIRPTVALVVCGTIILISSVLSLVFDFFPLIKPHTLLRTATTFLLPAISLLASIISTSFYYSRESSFAAWTLKSWSCQWSSISMTTSPHFSTLCAESKAGVYLNVMIIPLEIFVLGCAGFATLKGGRRVDGNGYERKGSPISMS